MNRKSRQFTVSGGVANVALFALFALAPLAVGLGLLAIRDFAVAETRAARNWVATPCLIETCAYRQGGTRGERKTLAIVYHYQFGGQSYRGDRLDLLAGSMGDDAAWEKRIFEQHPPGSEATCYVDPTNPANSVFDRDNAASKSHNLWLLAFPFLCVGAGFTLALLQTLFASRDGLAVVDATSAWHPAPGPPPRRVTWLALAAVIAGPRGAQLAWLFVVGFTYVFVVLDGPKQYAALLWPERREAEVIGRIVDVRRLQQRELHESVYQYDVEYEVDGRRHACTSATRGQRYRRGEEVTLYYPRTDPARAVIAGARESSLLWWHSAIPLGVLALLGLGLAGTFWNNAGVAWLLRRGQVARARWIEKSGDDAAVATLQIGNEAPRAPSRFHFSVSGADYRAYAYGPVLDRHREKAEEAPVLYDARRPERNVLFHGTLAALVRGQSGRMGLLLHCAPAPLAALAIWLLFAVQ